MTPARQGKGSLDRTRQLPQGPTSAERHAAVTRAQRRVRDFGIDIEMCPTCDRAVPFSACIEDAHVIAKIPFHRDEKDTAVEA